MAHEAYTAEEFQDAIETWSAGGHLLISHPCAHLGWVDICRLFAAAEARAEEATQLLVTECKEHDESFDALMRRSDLASEALTRGRARLGASGNTIGQAYRRMAALPSPIVDDLLARIDAEL